MDKEQMKTEITKLIEKYNREKSKRYNEEATKNDFILPLFKILGWAVEDSNEVSKEENISGKRVDYGFRIDGIPKFFLEAKGLDEDLEGSRMVKGRQVTYAEQAINYAYYKGCNWAILTNFKGIIVYDAWAKMSSQSSFRFAIWVDSLLNDFESVYLLSKEAFEQGLLDKKYSTKSRKRPISEQLLLDFTNFRAILSKDVYALNKGKNLTEEELDEAIQRLFDRLIFIRNCEDRELEPYDLLSALRQWKESRKGTLVSKLRDLFTRFDETYNSKIFSKHLCDQVDISDNVLSRILDGLYTTEDGSIQYDFSLIDADVLGNIYEQYLGHILKKTKLTESKAKRKEEGIYYTPSYIVDYIVRNTVGELVKNKKIDVSKIRVLDPACGSGSFLIKTFDVLNEYYGKKEGYNQNKLDMSGTGTTYSTKLSILKDNIFGVDLDKQAVDIAQLNLLLKVAEKKRRLPILQQNIKNGNSLIDGSNVVGEKAFKWNQEFSEIMKEGGFDVVIGNPPYINVETIPQDQKEFLKQYECFAGKSDVLYYFYNRGISLLKPDGILGFITSRYFIEATYAKNLRKYILDNCEILKILDLSSLPVFKEVGIHTAIVLLKKKDKKMKTNNKIIYKELKAINQLDDRDVTLLKQSDFDDNGWVLGTKDNVKLFKIIDSRKTTTLGDISIIEQGQKTGLNEAYTVTTDIIKDNKLEKEFLRKLVKNSYIEPYSILDKGLYLIYASEELNEKKAPNIISYLQKFKKELTNRTEARDGLYSWYRLQRPRSKELFDAKEKIIVPYRAEFNKFGYDDKQRYNDGGDVRIIVMKNNEYPIKYILAILNSKLMNYYYRFIGRKKGTSFEYFVEPLQKIPIVKTDRAKQEQLIELVDKVLSSINEVRQYNNKGTDRQHKIEEDLSKVRVQIDELVYKIYGITGEEKKVIEESISGNS